MRLVTPGSASLAIHARPSASALLDIDPETFQAKFDKAPFLISHRLVDHPLFTLPRLMELAGALPAANVEYNAGNIPISLEPERTPRNGLSVDETIRRIAECKSWMVLKYVEHDPAYRELLESCLSEVKAHSEPLRPGMQQAQGFIFLTSPGSVTPYHMDPEHNFLLQIRGSKTVHLFDGRDRSIISDEDLERFYGGSHRNMRFEESFRPKEWAFDLRPGLGLHFPVTAPHFVENGSEVSVSFSITFRTPDLERRSIIHVVNAGLRRRGWQPSPIGKHPWRDGLKVQAYRLWRRTRRLLGRPAN